MNKKVLYALIFTSIFILSTVAMVAQPVAGANWKYGVPDEAKGVTTEGEVKVYEKDDWGKHIGYDDDDTANQWFGGGETGANDVGAKTKSKIKDWERADIPFLTDHVLYGTIGANVITPDGTRLYDYWDAFNYVQVTTAGFATRRFI